MKSELKPFQKISVNGKILSADDPVVPAADPGLLYGYGVFDTLRVYKKSPFMLDRHIERLLSAAQSININAKPYEGRLYEWMKEFIHELDITDFIVRITVTKGAYETPCIVITGRPHTYTHKHYENGFSVCISSIKRNAHSPLAKIKSLNYLDNILARHMANEEGFDEALMLNGDDFLCECSMSNLFFVKDERILTPALYCGVLNGITRTLVIETIAPYLKLPICEGEFKIENLTYADEAFITNSAMGIMPLVLFEGYPIGVGKPGNITESVTKCYESLLDLGVRD